MARYIDAEAVKLNIQRNLMPNVDYDGTVTVENAERYFLNLLDNTPTADVVEVKHGEWQDKFNRNRMVSQSFCSVCGKHSGIGGIESNRHKPYCPNCGAKMDGERKCDE